MMIKKPKYGNLDNIDTESLERLFNRPSVIYKITETYITKPDYKELKSLKFFVNKGRLQKVLGGYLVTTYTKLGEEKTCLPLLAEGFIKTHRDNIGNILKVTKGTLLRQSEVVITDGRVYNY